MKRFGFVLSIALTAAVAFGQVKKSTMAGVTNLAQVETTVACAGNVTNDAVAGIKKMGYNSLINLRQTSEQGVDIPGETAAAKAAGINFIHLPFNGSMPDPAVVDQFLKVLNDRANQPAFIHCASGNRAAALWMVKRILVDKWDIERASEEATQLGLTSSALKTFALDYVISHQR
jgi:uncharacterized protein (TIGR01244 family)